MKFPVLIAAIALAGCNTPSGSYVRLDGSAIDPTKYEVDRTVCKARWRRRK
jgi:hypothetical protein